MRGPARHSRAWAGTAGPVVEASQSIARRHAMRWAAYELIRTHSAAFAALDEKTLVAFAVGLDSWESVDAFGRTLSGPAWVRGQVGDGLIRRWAGSSDRWLRRTALVSTVALNMPGDGGQGCSATLDIVERLVRIVTTWSKALSWAPQSGDEKPEAVRAFPRPRRWLPA